MNNFLKMLNFQSSKICLEAIAMLTGSIASALAGFIGIKFLTHTYSSSEYGVAWLLLNAVSLLVLLTSGRISQTVSRYYYESLSNKWYDTLNQYIKNYLFKLLLFSLLALVFIVVVSSLINFSKLHLISMISAIFLFYSSSLYNIALSLLNVSRKRVKRMLLSVFDAWGKPIMAIVLAYIFYPNISTFVVGYTIPVIVLSLLSFIIIKSYCNDSMHNIKKSAYRKEQYERKKRQLDKYAATWVWISLATWSLALLDRYIVGQMLGAAAAGKYVAAYQVGSALFQLAGGVYGPLVQPLVFGSAIKSQENCSLLMTRSYSIFTVITVPLLFFFLCVHKELFYLLTSHDYKEGIAAVSWIGLGGFLWIYANLSMDIYHLKNMNKLLIKLLFIVVLFNVFLTILLVKFMGIHGAGIASAGTYLFYALLLIFFSKKLMVWYFPVKILYLVTISSSIALIIGLIIKKFIIITSPIYYIFVVGVVFFIFTFTVSVIVIKFLLNKQN